MNRYAHILLIISALVWGIGFYSLPPFDPDLGWHLFGGSWVLAQHAVPRTDPINAFNLVWHDYHWLAQILIFKVYQAWSWIGLKVLLGVSCALTLGLTVMVAELRKSAHKPLVLVALAICGWLFADIVSLRPQLFALVLLLLGQWTLRRGHRLSLPILFLLTAITANIHVYWAFFLVLWFCYRCLPGLIANTSRRADWYGLLLLSLAPTLSPYGIFGLGQGAGIFDNYFLVLSYLHTPGILSDTIAEFRSTLALRLSLSIAFVVLLLLLAWSWSAETARRYAADISVTVLCAMLALIAVKYLGLFCTIGAAGMVRILEQATFHRRGYTALPTLLLIAVCARTFSMPQVDSLEAINQMEPYSLCRTLAAQHRAGDDTRVLTHFNHGGWCRFALWEVAPQIDFRVTTDNRTQSVPAEHYQRSFDLFSLKPGWAVTLKDWHPQYAVIHENFALSVVLPLARGDWEVLTRTEPFILLRAQKTSVTN